MSIQPTTQRFLRLINQGQQPLRIDNAQASLVGVDLSTLIQMAYQLPKYRVVLPQQVTSAHFSIQAKLPQGATTAQVPEMLKTMLQERFAMAAHIEPRVLPVYFLEPGRKLPKLKPSRSMPADQQGCKITGITYQCRGVTMTELADELTKGYYMASAAREQGLAQADGLAAQWPDRPVIDNTGLSGSFDFSVEFGKPNNGNTETRSALAALQSLGLGLRAGQQPLDFLIVDRIATQPTGN